jgi:hypothetical protein
VYNFAGASQSIIQLKMAKMATSALPEWLFWSKGSIFPEHCDSFTLLLKRHNVSFSRNGSRNVFGLCLEADLKDLNVEEVPGQ